MTPPPVSPITSSSSSLSRWFLPALAAFSVLGVVAVGTWLLHDEPKPATNKAGLATRSQPPVASNGGGASIQVPTPASEAAALRMAAVSNAKKVAGSRVDGSAVAVSPNSTGSASSAGKSEALTDSLSAMPAFDPGETARVHVSVDGQRTPLLLPNQVGAFPRVYLPPSGQADVQMQLPDAAPGDQVVAAVEDGGRFANGRPVQAFTLDDQRQLAFQFQANENLGNYRVSVRHGAQTKIVTFWVGDHASAFNH